MGLLTTLIRNAATPAVLAVAALGIAGCAGTVSPHPTNADLYGQYQANAYEGEIVGAEYAHHDASDVQTISPQAIASVQEAIEVTYRTDFEHCFESELERLELERLSAEFALEIGVSPEGSVTATKVLDATTPSEHAHEAFHGPDGVADRFAQCISEKLADWEIEHPPEAHYEHSYALKLGEAW